MTSAIGGVGEHSARSGSDVFVIRIGDLESENLKNRDPPGNNNAL
jgi:hypothetical protein